jgi:chromosome partitioning protein
MAASSARVSRTAHVVAICSMKGGTGKSTVAVNLACAVAHAGGRVALVDADPQASAMAWARAGRLPARCVALPLASDDGEALWLRHLQALRQEVTLVVIDLPAGDSRALSLACRVASLVLVAASDSALELEPTKRILQELQPTGTQPMGPWVRVVVVPNRLACSEGGSTETLPCLAGLGVPLAPPLHWYPEHQDAAAAGIWVGEQAAGSAAHQEIIRLAEHVFSHLVMLCPVEEARQKPSIRAAAPALKVIYLDEAGATQLAKQREHPNPLAPWVQACFEAGSSVLGRARSILSISHEYT